MKGNDAAWMPHCSHNPAADVLRQLRLIVASAGVMLSSAYLPKMART